MADTFRSFIAKLIAEHGTATAVAEAIDMSVSAFTRGVRHEGTLGVEKCLRLAKWSGEPASRVLELARKADVARLCEELYGPATALPLSEPERRRHELWRHLDRKASDALDTLLAALADASSEQRSRRRA